MNLNIRSLIQMILRLFRRRGPRITILNLPPELLVEIASCLSPPAQVCLALACKYMYWCIGNDVQNAKELRFPRLIQNRKCECIPVTPRQRLRWELLGLLENKRWRYCADCLKLHPAGEFKLAQRRQPRSERLCVDSINSYRAYIVDICPCFRMTFRDKLHMVYDLNNSSVSATTGLLNRFFRWNGIRYIHQCWHAYTESAVYLEASPILQGSDRLLFEIRYEVAVPAEQPPGRYGIAASLHNIPIQVCSHATVALFLSHYACDGKAEYFLSTCTRCQTHVAEFERIVADSVISYSIAVVRDIGDGEQPDETWHQQGNLAYHSFNNVEW